MARICTVKPEFREDEKVARLPPLARLFFIALWNFADDQGVIKNNLKILKSKIFPYDNIRLTQMSIWLDALVDVRMLIPIRFNNESYFIIHTFRNHQLIDKRYFRCIIPKELVNRGLALQSVLRVHSQQEREKNIPPTPLKGDE